MRTPRKWPETSKFKAVEDEYLERLRADFRNFLYALWEFLNLPQPTPVQYDIAQFLQGGPRRLVIEAFRGVGKSWITAAFCIWLLLRNPNTHTLVVSASKDRSDAFSTFVKQIINNWDVLAHLRPRPGQRDSLVAFDVGGAEPSQSPSVKSVGITGQITGSRAEVIIADDIETLNNSLTQLMRDRLSEAVKEFDAVLTPNGRIIYLGTPQTEQSIYNVLPERGYSVRIWPARYPDDKLLRWYGDRLAPFIADRQGGHETTDVGAPTDPSRFTVLDLAEREASYGRSGFSLQFMLDTSLSDADRYPLRLSDLSVLGLDTKNAPEKVVWGSSPALIHNDLPAVGLAGDRYYRPMAVSDGFQEYTGSVMFIDPSGRGKDETAYAIVRILFGTLFLIDCGGFQSGYGDETLEALAKAAKDGHVNRILIEKNFGDGMFNQLLKPVLKRVYPCVIEEVHSVGQKELRIIDTLEPLLNQHRVVVDEKVVLKDYETAPDPTYSLFYQLTRITKERGALRHDDRLEAFAAACRYWSNQMAVEQDAARDAAQERQLRKDLETFSKNILGRGRPKRAKFFRTPRG